MGAAVAAVLVKERHIVDAVARAGAVSPERAQTADALGADHSGIGWHRLRSRSVIREVSPGSGLFYLDVEAWQQLRRLRRRRMMGFMVVLVVIVVASGVMKLTSH